MLRTATHRKYMFEIVSEIYKLDLSKKLAFKGGTLCYFLYDLDRFSTDLDFDAIEGVDEDQIFKEIESILLSK